MPAPKVAGARSLGSALTVVGGLGRTAKPKTLLASLVVARRAGGEAGVSGVTVQVRLPRGARFGRFVRRHVVRSVDAAVGNAPGTARRCRAASAYVLAKPLAGRALSRDGRADGRQGRLGARLRAGAAARGARWARSAWRARARAAEAGRRPGRRQRRGPRGREEGGPECGDEDYSPAVSLDPHRDRLGHARPRRPAEVHVLDHLQRARQRRSSSAPAPLGDPLPGLRLRGLGRDVPAGEPQPGPRPQVRPAVGQLHLPVRLRDPEPGPRQRLLEPARPGGRGDQRRVHDGAPPPRRRASPRSRSWASRRRAGRTGTRSQPQTIPVS